MVPCAVKGMPFSTELDQICAEAELAALAETHHDKSVVTCLGVFLDDAAPDGTIYLQVALE